MKNAIDVQHLTWNKNVKAFLIAFSAGAIALMLPLCLIMYPTKDASLEMKTVYYILVVPKWVTSFFVVGIDCILIYVILRKIFLRKRKGVLTFTENKINFVSPKKTFSIDIESLKSIHFVPKRGFKGDLLILTKKDTTRIFFNLLEEDQFEDLFRQLLLFDDKVNIKTEPYDMIEMSQEGDV